VHRGRGFTLIELLVSTSLILVVVTVATTASVQMLTLTRRLQARLALDAAAATVHTRLGGEVTSMHPCAAVWLSSSASAKSVELVFMRMAYSTLDFPTVVLPALGNGKRMNTTEQFWTRWFWRFDTRELRISASQPVRFFRIANDQARDYWKIPGGSRMLGSWFSTFVSIPQIQRDTGTAAAPDSPQALLDGNAWQSGEARDVGDYQDLLLNSRTLLAGCTDLSIELSNLDGTTKRADGGADLQWAAPGSYVDAQDQGGLTARPSLVRLRFTLTDEKTGAVGTYSLSFSTPSQTAY